ncbi:cache domain-containing sensor histidine kinase [Cohnella caldifontis]|uniref:cache domain-containing sensor histidine kinase n=1 Tax=Cohnella caldifontis TaxID=3027471 RepID=UPI0023ECAF1A|nr:sensor histidine kinase [Cohnella sp. YIM B05605]
MRQPVFSWRQRLILTSLLCLVLPSILALALTGMYTKNELRNKAVAKAEQSLEVAELYESNLMRDMINAFNSIQYDSEMITELRVAWNKFRSDKTGVVDFFSFRKISEKLDHLTFFGGKTYVSILLPDGLYFTNFSTYKNDLSFMYKEPWLEALSREPVNSTVWHGTQPNYVKADADKDPHLITIVRTFQLYANSPNAYLILSKPEEQFRQIFSKYAEDQTMMLLDADGKIVSHTDPARIGQFAPDPAPDAGPYRMIREGGRGYLSVSHSLPFAGWSMRSLTPYESATSNVGPLFNYVSVLQLVLFLVFAGLLYYLLNQWTLPIKKLARTASKVEKGFLEERSRVRGRDEIGHLGLAFDQMLDRVEEMIAQVEREQTRKRMAELELLQAQMNPHFLFNTLNSIRMRAILKGEAEIGGVLGSLSSLLRMTINRNNEFVALHEEVETVRRYLDLVQFRHGETVKLKVQLASDAWLELIPRFTLQPLVENAHLHGLRQGPGEIAISAWKQPPYLMIQVRDDGVGMPEDKLAEIRSGAPATGIGLRNVKERLRILYGSLFDMELSGAPGSGLSITLKIPIGAREEQSHVPSHAGG